ncbi:MAG: TIGR04283 family arsenosugar biosynthesis glycosyltransferase [Acidobacteriota bacterium]|nr:TIGR04283 family arsenosugar biosynthesis glycosyltransferase [Acidobacteriota bacterium]
MTFSIIIPTLNEELALPGTLKAIFQLQGEFEVIVSDGGSTDETVAIAAAAGAKTIASGQGRGQQQAAGARRATGDVLWFLHADSVPDPDSLNAIERVMRDDAIVAGNFSLRFDGETRAARNLTLAYPYLRLLGLCYGDSGIFVRRRVYEAIGGFRAYPLFEDVDFARRTKRAGKFVRLHCQLTTSSRRFENKSFVLTFARWTFLQILFWAGVSPVKLAAMYSHARNK